MKSLFLALLPISFAAASPSASWHYLSRAGALTAPSSEPASEIGRQFLSRVAAERSLAAEDLEGLVLVREYRTAHNGVTHLIYRQQFHGVDVLHSDFVLNIDASGQVLNAGGLLYNAPTEALPAAASIATALRAAMRSADPSRDAGFTPMEIQGAGKARRFHLADGRGDIDARAIWFPVDGVLHPAWQLYLKNATGALQSSVVHSVSGTILETRPLTHFQSPPPPRGLVFTGQSPQPNPRPGFPMTEPPPYVERTLVSFAGDPQASPAGWIEGTETAGNNIIAGKNPLALTFLIEPVTAKSPSRDFQFPLQLGSGAPPPNEFIDAAITNLFYWMNRAHDLFWHIGFDEAAGNYQKQNFGRGGTEGDPLYVYAQFGAQQTFGAALNNAFYTTRGTEDGAPAMIAMFLGVGASDFISDGSYDSEVMIHEYTHGVSLRLVRNLGGHHGGAMGEAWSDFFALEFTLPTGAPPDGVYPTGDYLFQRFNVGIRTRPYSTDMSVNPITFADMGHVASLPAIHQDGGIWVQALLEIRSELIRQFGEAEGRRRVRLLVIDGMKLSIPAPTMVDARDAILLADRVNFKGESQAQIWRAFAKRGLGATAFARSNNSTDVTASNDAPTNTGVIAFSERSYVHGEIVRIILSDANLAGDIALVQLTSYEAGDVETVRLRRFGATFRGTISTSNFAAAVRENGVLSVLPGSVITAFYTDQESDAGARQVKLSVPTTLGYAQVGRAPSFQFSNETPLNLRAAAGAFQTFDLPWEFPFFGRNYSSVAVHANGLLSFDLPPGSVCLDNNLLAQMTGIAPMYGDFRTNGTAQMNENVYVSRQGDESITFRWAGETNSIAAFGLPPEPVNFAAVLYRDGRIEFKYGTGNRNVIFPSPSSQFFGCGSSPVFGISNGNGAVLTAISQYIGRANLENAAGVILLPPYGAGSLPEIRLETPNASDDYQGILPGRGYVFDNGTPVGDLWVVIDGVMQGRANLAAPPAACMTERLPNCIGFTFNLNFEALNLAPGPHNFKIIAANTRGGTTTREFTIRTSAGQTRVPVVVIDPPAGGSQLSATQMIRGYAAADNIRILGIDILVDGINYGRAQYGMPRPEVCQSLGFTSPNCPNVGFTFMLSTLSGALPLTNGEHRVQLRVQDETGRFTLYPETPLVFTLDREGNQRPRGVLVTPRHNDQVSGTVDVYGYAWDPDGRVQAVQLLVDGAVRATLPYGEARPSECAALSDVAACPNIGFWFEWNSRTVLNGPHVFGIRIIDDRGAATVVPQNASAGLTLIVRN